MAIKRSGLAIFIKGVQKYLSDIARINTSNNAYLKNLARMRAETEKLAKATRRDIVRALGQTEKRVQKLTNTYDRLSKKYLNLHARHSKYLSDLNDIVGATEKANEIKRKYNHILRTLERSKKRLSEITKKGSSAYKRQQNIILGLETALDKLGREKRKAISDSNKEKRILRNIAKLNQALDDVYNEIISTSKELSIERDNLKKKTNDLVETDKKAKSTTQQNNKVLETLVAVLDHVTNGFGTTIAQGKMMTDIFGEGASQSAVLIGVLDLLKISVDSLTLGITLVLRVFGMLLNIVGKIIGRIVKLAVTITGKLIRALIRLAGAPVRLAINTLKGLFRTLRRIWETMTAILLSGIIRRFRDQLSQWASIIFEAASNFQLLRIRLKGLVQRDLAKRFGLDYVEAAELSIEKTKELIDWISDLSIKTIFSTKTINNVLSLALAYDFTIPFAKDLTVAIANFTTGMGLTDEVMERIIENFGQMRNQGKITGTELRDLARGAFVPVQRVLERMAENLNMDASGEGIEDLKEKVSEGELPVDNFFKAFMDIVEEDFPNAIEKASESFEVIKSNVKDVLEVFLGWKVLAPVLDVVSKRLNVFMDIIMNERVRNVFEGFGNMLSFVTEYLFGLADGIDLNILKIPRLGKILARLMNLFSMIKKGDLETFKNTLAVLEIQLKAFTKIDDTGITTIVDGFQLLYDTINNPDISPQEITDNIGKSLDMIWTPLWNQWILPAIQDLITNIKEEIILYWQNEISPELQNFISDIALPGLHNFINETIPNWVQTLGENAPQIALYLTDTIGGALSGLSDWASQNVGENSPISLFINLLESLVNFIGLKIKGEDIYSGIGAWRPELGGLESDFNPFEDSGLKKSLDDIADALERAWEKGRKFITEFLEPVGDWMNENQKTINTLESLTNLLETIADVPINTIGLLSDLFNLLFSPGIPIGDGGGGRQGLLEFLIDLSSFIIDLTFNFPLETARKIIQVLDQFLSLAIRSLVSWKDDDFSGKLPLIRFIEDLDQIDIDVDDLLSPLRNLWDSLGNLFKGGEQDSSLDNLQNWIERFNEMETDISNIGNGSNAKVMFDDTLTKTENRFKTAYNVIIGNSIVHDLVNDIYSFLETNLPALLNPINRVLSDIENSIRGFNLVSAGQDTMRGLLLGFQRGFQNIIDWWQNIALPKLIEIYSAVYGQQSPSRVWENMGSYTAQGLEIGLSKGLDKVSTMVQDKISQIQLQAMNNNASYLANRRGVDALNRGYFVRNTQNTNNNQVYNNESNSYLTVQTPQRVNNVIEGYESLRLRGSF